MSGVWGPGGEALDFIQEDKDHDADFAVVLQKPLKAGETIQITTSYAGKDAVVDMGSGNYFLVARERLVSECAWYAWELCAVPHDVPHAEGCGGGGDGKRISDKEEGGKRTSEWQTSAPIAVAGLTWGVQEQRQRAEVGRAGGELCEYALLTGTKH